MAQPCEQKETILNIQHDILEIAKSVAKAEEYRGVSKELFSELFDKLAEIKTYVDQNAVSAHHRDEKLDEIIRLMGVSEGKWSGLRDQVKTVQLTVENGLNTRVDQVAQALQEMKQCMERRREEYAKQVQEDDREFGSWRRFGRMLARNINRLIEKNTLVFLLLFVFFILWLGYGGDGQIIHHILSTLQTIVGGAK